MEILHQYYYRQRLAAAKAVIYTILSVVFVAFGVYSFIHWELSFMLHDWHGYVILIAYSLMTLAMILSAVESFRKAAKSRRGIPAFAVGADSFVFYDKDGLPTTIPFADCEQVRFKTTLQFRVPTLKLIVKYHEKKDPENTLRFEVGLSELDRPVKEIDKQLKSVYRKYKNASPDQ
jgi:hypothetical protein